MVMEGETVSTGASNVCCDCGVRLTNQVLMSAAGYYIGTECDCGPYSRESGYYTNAIAAEAALKSGEYGR